MINGSYINTVIFMGIVQNSFWSILKPRRSYLATKARQWVGESIFPQTYPPQLINIINKQNLTEYTNRDIIIYKR